jgi:hypothetical protein
MGAEVKTAEQGDPLILVVSETVRPAYGLAQATGYGLVKAGKYNSSSTSAIEDVVPTWQGWRQGCRDIL